jgi:hypothetical protein
MRKDKMSELDALKIRILADKFTSTFIEDSYQYLN